MGSKLGNSIGEMPEHETCGETRRSHAAVGPRRKNGGGKK